LANQLVLDDAVFGARVQLELTAAWLFARRAQFPAGAHLRLRFASVVLDEGLIECTTSPIAGALIARARQEAANPTPGLALTPAQQQTASELPWYRHWLLEHGYSEDDLIPFAIA
jgi:hypothetical protein